jgi:hypothetical protein
MLGAVLLNATADLLAYRRFRRSRKAFQSHTAEPVLRIEISLE